MSALSDRSTHWERPIKSMPRHVELLQQESAGVQPEEINKTEKNRGQKDLPREKQKDVNYPLGLE